MLVWHALVGAPVEERGLGIALLVGLALQGVLVEELVIADDDLIAPVGDLVDVEARWAGLEINALVVDSVEPLVLALSERQALVGLAIQPLLLTAFHVVLACLGAAIEELVGIAVHETHTGAGLAIEISTGWAVLIHKGTLHAGSLLAIEHLPLATVNALLSVEVEDGLFAWAADALSVAEERLTDVAVGDVVVGDGSLVVLLNHVIQSLVAQNPVGGVEVGLPDRGR